jgi:ubiquinone/menaquinone biosynthesis C-methylase UbiE
MKNFLHDEFKQLGTDYNSVEEVAQYDQRMRRFRDIDRENRELVTLAGLKAGSSVLEIGTGTGAFAREAAKAGARVHAIDISAVMLEYARLRAREEKLDNLTFELAGFLSFEAEPASYDAVVTGLAMHHLSDVWKAVALRKIHHFLRPGGVLILLDVVFDWKNEAPEAYFERLLEYAPGSKDNFAKHIADELSTLTWIMNGLLERANFTIESDHCENDFLHIYQCRKQ